MGLSSSYTFSHIFPKYFLLRNPIPNIKRGWTLGWIVQEITFKEKNYLKSAYNSTIQVLWTAVSPNISSSSSRSSVANTTKSIQFPPLSLPSGLLCFGAVQYTHHSSQRGKGRGGWCQLFLGSLSLLLKLTDSLCQSSHRKRLAYNRRSGFF